MNERTVGTAMILIASACFGTLAIFGKAAQTAGLDTTTLLTYRFLFATALVWAGLAVWGRATVLPRDQGTTAIGLGVLYAAFTGLFFWGLLFIPAGVAGLAFYTYPVYVYGISVTVLDESLTLRKLAALVLALAGVGLMVGSDAASGGTANIDVLGVSLVMLAAGGYALYITGNRAALSNIDADVLAGTAMAASSLSFLSFGAVTGRLSVPAGTEQWLLVFGIAAVGTALPLFLYVNGLDRIPASNASVLSTAEPLVAVGLGIFLLGEALSLPLVVGGTLVLGGVFLIQTDIASEA